MCRSSQFSRDASNNANVCARMQSEVMHNDLRECYGENGLSGPVCRRRFRFLQDTTLTSTIMHRWLLPLFWLTTSSIKVTGLTVVSSHVTSATVRPFLRGIIQTLSFFQIHTHLLAQRALRLPRVLSGGPQEQFTRVLG